MEFLMQFGSHGEDTSGNLSDMVRGMWKEAVASTKESIFVVTGFADSSGVKKFRRFFTEFVKGGGSVKVLLSGNRNEYDRHASVQAAEKLLRCGAEVYVTRKKQILHAKCYGYSGSAGEELVVTSGNLTGAGMSKNGEAAVRLGREDVKDMGFSWSKYWGRLTTHWNPVPLDRNDMDDKKGEGWSYLYDENKRSGGNRVIGESDSFDETEEPVTPVELKTMILKLGDYDTKFIRGEGGANFFTLSPNAMDFFPALSDADKNPETKSCTISMTYADLNVSGIENHVLHQLRPDDYRLALKGLKNKKIADKDDLALITRIGEYNYELRFVRKDDPAYSVLRRKTERETQGKEFGYISNETMQEILD